MLVRIIKNWDHEGLVEQSPGAKGIVDDIQFTTEPVTEPDYVIVLNAVREPIKVSCPPENVWAVMQEPYVPGVFEWMVKGHGRYARVFTHHMFSDGGKYVASYPMLPWHVRKSYDELTAMAVPEKTKSLSSIISNKAFFAGHKKRLKFMDALREDRMLSIDMFGKGIQFIEDKWDGLAPYKYSLAIENSRSEDYWTEKLADCFLAFTMPIYYGCENLEAYFPKDAFIRIDINKPDEALQIIKTAIAEGAWEKNFDAIAEARDLVLNRYNFFFNMAREIQSQPVNAEQIKVPIELRPYHLSIRERIVGKIKRYFHGLKDVKGYGA